MADPVGRNDEREVIATFLAAASSAPALLTLQGDPGIGKTTLCRYGADRARKAGAVVLTCSPSAAESAMSFAGLTDLLAGTGDEVLDTLPSPQRHALAVATLREAPSRAPPDERAIGTALGSLVRTLASARPVVIVIDDAHWLDRTSADVVGFALRRITDIPVGVLTGRRCGVTTGLLDTILDAAAWHKEMKLEPLSPTALFHVVRDQLGITLARPALIRIADASRGNPFVALELARAGVDDFPIPDSLHELSVARLSRLSDGTRESLLAAACMPRPTTARLAELGLGDDLDGAEADGAIHIVDGRIEFAHPLLCTAALELAGAPDRRAMHRRLADGAPDPEEAAHHRAMATPGPDETVAVALSAAAESSSRRGASSTAAVLACLALARTEDSVGPMVWLRKVRAAELVYTSGDTAKATGLLDQLDSACAPGPVRGRGWLLLTQIAYQTSSQHRAQDCASRALADADDDPDLRAHVLLSLAALAMSNADRRRYAGEAKRCLQDAGIIEPSLLAWAMCEDINARFYGGDGLDREALDRALAMERTGRPWSSDDQVAAARPVLLKWADRHEEALEALVELEERASAEGNEGIIAYALGHRSNTLLRMGRYAEAEAVAADQLFQAEVTGQSGQRIQALHNLAAVDAHLGRLDLAASRAQQVLDWAEQEQDPWLEMNAAGLLGFVALSSDRAADACRWFERWSRAAADEDVIDPGISRHHGDQIEALVAMGELTTATQLTSQLTDVAVRSGRVSAAAVASRCRGILAASGADHQGAMSHLESSLRLLDGIDLPFETARTHFVKGIVHRRAKQKRRAREDLTASERDFRALHAQAWAARATAELGRIGSRPAATFDLTGTERRIAELAASGLTNRHVAEQAFISPKTVEANLAKVYRKLGISSRAELGASMARLVDAEADAAAPPAPST